MKVKNHIAECAENWFFRNLGREGLNRRFRRLPPIFLVLQRNQLNVGAPGRASVPRATGPARGTESQCFSAGERLGLEKFNALRLEWLVRTRPTRARICAWAFRIYSFFFFVFLPLVSVKNHFFSKNVPIPYTDARFLLSIGQLGDWEEIRGQPVVPPAF
jgi:hypothetical protein